MATEPLVIRQPDKIPPVVTRSKEPEPFLSRITSEGDDQVTLWPRPTDDSESSDREGSPSTSNTNAESSDITPYLSRITSSGMEPPETVVTEESTITGDMITKTDSGSTVTVPNNEVVTITRHTTILTDRPPPLPSTTLLTSVTTPVDVPGSSSASATGGEPGENTKPANNGPGLTTGAFVGISVGGAVVIAILVLVIFTVKKRRRKQQDEQDATRNDDFGRDEAVEEKHFPDQMTPHTTGTQGDDPFAPFGGTCFQKYSKANNGSPTKLTLLSQAAVIEHPRMFHGHRPTSSRWMPPALPPLSCRP